MKWRTKNISQKELSSSSHANFDSAATSSSSATAAADIGISVLEKRNGTVPMSTAVMSRSEVHEEQQSTSLVVDYGGTTESSSDEEVFADIDYLYFTNLTCNLCKRQFTSAETLTKRSKLSSLHKQNLEAKRGRKKGGCEKIVYRDRTKKHRMKYGDPDEPQPSKLKEKYLKSRELVENLPVATTSVMEPIGTENIGNKLLQKMGWIEGQAVGKSNQGETSIIQVEQRSSTVGLGNKAAAYSTLAGESYKECVKKMM